MESKRVKAHWAYLKYMVRHKWYVLLECRKLGIPWQGFIHDWHKFLPGEWFPYVHYFYHPDGSPRSICDETGYYHSTDTGDVAFNLAWLLHQKRGHHHWQWWVLVEDEGNIKTLEMPDRYVREMVADWRGAGRAQGKPDTLKWYQTNKDKMRLHPDTRAHVEELIGYSVPKEIPEYMRTISSA